jgi:hypothetical protein
MRPNCDRWCDYDEGDNAPAHRQCASGVTAKVNIVAGDYSVTGGFCRWITASGAFFGTSRPVAKVALVNNTDEKTRI